MKSNFITCFASVCFGAVALTTYGAEKPTNTWNCDTWLKAFVDVSTYNNRPDLHITVNEEAYYYRSEEDVIAILRSGYRDNEAVFKEDFATEDEYVKAALDYAMQRNAERHTIEYKEIYLGHTCGRILAYSNISAENLISDTLMAAEDNGHIRYMTDGQTGQTSRNLRKSALLDEEYYHYGTLSYDIYAINALVKQIESTTQEVKNPCEGPALNENGEGILINDLGDRVEVKMFIQPRSGEYTSTYLVDKQDARKVYSKIVTRKSDNAIISSETFSDFVDVGGVMAYPRTIVIESYDRESKKHNGTKTIKVERVEIMQESDKAKILSDLEKYK